MLYNASLSGMKSTVSLVRWYAENAQRILKSEEFTDNGTNGKYIYDPLGVIF
ncbi:MAG: hypothetical protein Q8S84_03775 [bacterium]|nr:hypothetical protein [bacterium]MDP3380640.1 hypothetical protein [bacterium]